MKGRVGVTQVKDREEGDPGWTLQSQERAAGTVEWTPQILGADPLFLGAEGGGQGKRP